MMEKQKWRSVKTLGSSSSRPSPRWGHSNCVIGEEVVLFGGYADSIYMNDLWTFNTRSMIWTEVETTGDVPAHRSNCSLNYDAKNNRIIMFGGGGSNRTRYNSISILDWNTKVWTELVPKENETAPWQRTYHTAELAYPYLIVFGGEGIADLDDLWVYNFQTSLWAEIPIEKGAAKPCARRFHSSCLIGNQFFVVAGCHTKYRCLNDIYSIDLTNLVESGSLTGMEWKERKINGYAFLTRWGHTSSACQDKIYIFGGRFSNDLNDLLVFDPEKDELKCLKVAPETIPKPRRRPSTCFIGSCLLMFGGFNQDYYNDLHYINVGLSVQKPKKISEKAYNVSQFINDVEVSDMVLATSDNEPFYCHRGFIRNCFQTEQMMNVFVESFNGLKTKEQLTEIMEILYRNYGSYQHIAFLPTNQKNKEECFLMKLEGLGENKQQSIKNIFMKPIKRVKLFCNCIAVVGDDHYSDFLEKSRELVFKDTTIIINNLHKLDVCSPKLRSKSNFFNNILSKKYKRNEQNNILHLQIPGNVVLFEMLVNFMLHNYLVVPESMSSSSWIELYDLADYLSLKNMKQIISHYLETLITESSVSQIFTFSQKQKIEHLSLSCAQFQIKFLQNFEAISNDNKYIVQAFEMNKFQLKQVMLNNTNSVLFKKKTSSDSVETEGEKENYEVANS